MKKPGFFQEFKQFIMRGNIVDMAVGVIIGGAFSAIVTALTNKIIKPFIDWIVMLATGGRSLGLYTFMKKVMMDTAELDAAGKPIQTVDFANSIYIDWGAFIMAIIDFLLIALVLFIIIKVIMKVKNASLSAHEKAKEKLAKKLEEQGMSEDEAKAQAEAQVAAEEAAAPAAPAAPTAEELLVEIRDLLAAQNKDKE